MRFLIVILVVMLLALVVSLSRARREARKAKEDAQRAREEARSSANELTTYRARESALGNLEARLQLTTKNLEEVRAALADADRLLEEKEPIIYPRRFPDETSEELKERMDAVRVRQSEIRRKGQVVIRFGASVQDRLSPEERAKLKALVRLGRLALEGAADTLVDQVKAANQERLETRFRALVTDLNRLLQPWGFEIGKNYQATVRDALTVTAEYLQQVEKERQEQRALREQMREEAAALREAERAQREAETEERRAERELQKAQEAASKATLEERERWLARVQELEQALATAHAAKDRAIAMAQLTKSGHVYIISNVGSFGTEVFKVGMTRRLDPEDRISELGDASVPFPFDIHGMIPSNDAPALEAELHRALEPHRVNLVNERKEFFNVPFGFIKAEVEKQGLSVKLTEIAEAAEYRQSASIRKGLAREQVVLDEEEGAEDPADVAGEMGSTNA